MQWTLGLLVVFMAALLGLFAYDLVRSEREARRWEEFWQEHCRISGSYDKEAGRATPLVVAGPGLKVYHCDDGSIHVR